jgi:putative glutamine amidotransferase
MSSHKPLIGVTGPVQGGLSAWLMTWLALKRADAKAVRITVNSRPEEYKLDGLILGGGSDIDPGNYGEELQEIKKSTHKKKLRYRLWSVVQFFLRALFSIKTGQPAKDLERDRLEIGLCLDALKKRLPVLGICRGMQLINVALGGSLHQDTRGFYTETPHVRTILSRKRIHLKDGAKLRRTLGVERCRVNSLHEQAVRDLGENLIAAALDENGIVQAVEHTEHPFLIGVQWHPEYLPQIKKQQRIFKAIVDSAKSTIPTR